VREGTLLILVKFLPKIFIRFGTTMRGGTNFQLERMTVDMQEKDTMLESLQQSLRENTARADELIQQARTVAERTADSFRTQIAEKDKQLQIMQSLLEESKVSTVSSSSLNQQVQSRNPDRAFMDEFLLTVLEQKDRLADQLHSLNSEYAKMKARLGMTEFEKEKLEAASRAQTRRRGSSLVEEVGGSIGGGGGGGGGVGAAEVQGREQDVSKVERARLSFELAEANDKVRALQARLDEKAPLSAREVERRRRKLAFKNGRSPNGVLPPTGEEDELDIVGLRDENQRLRETVAERTAQLAAVTDQLEQSLTAQETMAASMAGATARSRKASALMVEHAVRTDHSDHSLRDACPKRVFRLSPPPPPPLPNYLVGPLRWCRAPLDHKPRDQRWLPLLASGAPGTAGTPGTAGAAFPLRCLDRQLQALSSILPPNIE
jgi:hypothetical protein